MLNLTEEQRILRDAVRRMARERIAPLAAGLDEAQAMPHEVHGLLVRRAASAPTHSPSITQPTASDRRRAPRNFGSV